MAQAADEIIRELEGFYAPQKQLVQQQVAQLPQYYDAQTQGLGVAKDNAFRDITNQASARGIAYSGMPIAEQTRYTGEKYLPALAGLKKDQNDQNFSLQGTLADIASRQAQQAYGIREKQVARDEQARQAALDRQLAERQFAQEQAAKRSSGGSSARGGSSAKAAAAPQMNDYVALINSLRSTGKIGDSGYGSIADYLRQQGEDISRGSAADKALRKAFGFG